MLVYCELSIQIFELNTGYRQLSKETGSMWCQGFDQLKNRLLLLIGATKIDHEISVKFGYWTSQESKTMDHPSTVILFFLTYQNYKLSLPDSEVKV